MALKTATEQLEEVQACISDLLAGGQQVEMDGQRLTMASLDALTKREEMLRERVSRDQRGTRGFRISIGTQGR